LTWLHPTTIYTITFGLKCYMLFSGLLVKVGGCGKLILKSSAYPLH